MQALINDHQISIRWCATFPDHIRARPAQRDLKLQLLQLALQNIRLEPAGMHQQDMRQGLGDSFGHTRGSPIKRERQPEPEIRAAPLFGLHPDLAPHQPNQFAGDRQAKPCPVEGAIALILDLRELAEHRFQLFFGNANARIFYRHVQLHGVRRLILHTDNADQDMAFLRELDRIPDQVGQHLPNPSGIPNKARGQEQIVVKRQFQILVARGGLHEREHFMDQTLQVEGFGHQAHLGGLKF